MAFDEVYKRLEEVAKRLDELAPEVAIVQSMNELQADFLQRVFVDGENSNNGKIGDYDTEPYYATKNQFIRTSAFKPQGKDGSTKFKVVKRARKSMYLKEGYKEFREIQARPTNTVNLDLSGSLKRAYRVFKFGDSVLFGQNDEFEHKKIEGLTDRFGEWQSFTQQEVERLKTSIPENIKIIIENDKATAK